MKMFTDIVQPKDGWRVEVEQYEELEERVRLRLTVSDRVLLDELVASVSLKDKVGLGAQRADAFLIEAIATYLNAGMDFEDIYDVIARSDIKFGQMLRNVQNMLISVPKNSESIIQLKDICMITKVNTVSQILRYNEQYSIEVIATAKAGIKLQEAVNFLDQLSSKLPNDTNIIYTDQTQMLIDSTSSFTILITIAVLGLYLLMFGRFNNLVISLIILVIIKPK
jgi:multidrug efflux pump subunit AcrB